MQQRLKKERNRLYRRVMLILFAVWLAVSAAFAAVRLNIEKANVRTDGLSDLSHVTQLLTVGGGSSEAIRQAFTEYTDLIYDDAQGRSPDTHMIITDRDSGQTVADTADTLAAEYSLKWHADETVNFVALIDRGMLLDGLSESQLSEIEGYLSAPCEDGSCYELICTRLQYFVYLIPLELKIVLVNGSDPRLLTDSDVATYDLSDHLVEGYEVYETGETHRNVIPMQFLSGDLVNPDIIGSLTKEQRSQSVGMIEAGFAKYIFYASDSLNLIDEQSGTNSAWEIQMAKRVDLFESCGADLIFGITLIFLFFFTIGAILCVMIWRTVKAQIVQEQKRLELTNALAHDIKTPLFVISGYAYSLKEDIDEEERELYLDKIIAQTDEVNSLVHRMLDYSKLDSYRMTLNKTAFDLSAAARDILRNYTALPDNKRIAFTHSGENGINADQELVKTALQNLIDNAVKYSLTDSEIQIDVTDSTFTVSNRAEPMTADELRQLWKPYVRKHKSRRKGNGLGLSIVKSILDLHGAKYHMEMKEKTLRCQIIFNR